MWRSIVMWVGGTHYNQARMSEWSKEADLRDSTRIIKYLLHQRVGSNPTSRNSP